MGAPLLFQCVRVLVMSFKNYTTLYTMGAVFLLLLTSPIHAKAALPKALSVTPKQCIALHKGQLCYLDVTFKWQQSTPGNYCLVNITTSNLVKCWSNREQAELEYDFKAIETHQFALRSPHSDVNIATTKIPVVWVYKSKRRTKSAWRLF